MDEIELFGKTRKGRGFIKMHGLENHFVITDARQDSYAPDDAEVIRICNPRTGIGADQLVVIESPRSAGADVFMRILNIDGREVEACGNATRCAAWLLMEESGQNQVTVETLAGALDCKRAGEKLVSCTMGMVSMDWREIPLGEERDTRHLELPYSPLDEAVALNIGNPHVVFFVDDIDAIDILTLAPRIQADELFPDQVNVGVAQMISAEAMRLVVYERGAGLTTACGSGACVAVYAALARGLTDQRTMTVTMPAGDVRIGISKSGEATMIGPVEYCFSGIL